jgi:penicillin G amidase
VTDPSTPSPTDAQPEIPRQADRAAQGVPPDAERAEGEPPVKPKRRWRRALAWMTTMIVVIVLALAGVGVWQVRRAFPQYDGVLHVKGLSAPVTVYRDDHAIPQLYARSADDLFKAQGYVGAQERFWEMDFRRHVTSGRLSEMFGPDQLDTDVYLRTLGWRHVAEQEWQLISPQTRRYLQDYADGVNAYLDGKAAGRISLEYTVLGLQNHGYRIEKWDPIDSLAWLKAMAWDLRGNMDDEITRGLLLASGLTEAQVDSLYPVYPYALNKPIVGGGSVVSGHFTPSGAARSGDAVTTGEARALIAVRDAIEGIPLGGEKAPGIGSNSWVISGRLTSTGKPILANDPHLSTSMPGIWYQMGLHCDCPLNVEGFTFSGMPGVVIGHNGRIAWGFTNLNPDVTDLYLEKIRGNEYEVDGAWKPMTLHTEVIRVAGGPPKTITVRSTDNGPLLSDADDTLDPLKPAVNGFGVCLRWTALTPGRTMDALFALDTASDFGSFRAAAALFEVPAQNIVYADVDGNIGYQAPGRIPIRGKGDGRYPAPGWDSAYDWKGYIPFDQLPYVENPSDGFIATANQAVIDPATYQPFLTDDWSYGYRSQRIRDMITGFEAAGHHISTADVAAMQFDNRNDFAAQITSALLGEHVTGQTARALSLLRGWDFTQPASSAAAAYFNEFWRDLCLDTFDELPAEQKPDGYDRWFVVINQLMNNPTSSWWDDKRTPAVETRDDIVTRALTRASAQLTAAQGKDVTEWQWGKLHTMLLANQSLGESGIGPVEWLFNYGPVSVPGGNDAVNATGMTLRDGFDVDASPSMRMIVDLSDLDNSRWVELTGESGHAFSTHYHDQLDLWLHGKNLPMRWDQTAIQRAAEDKLTLTP